MRWNGSNQSRTPEQLVDEDRGKVYGHPWDAFNRYAQGWSQVLGATVTPEQVALCMITFKVARCVAAGGYDEDSCKDIQGYAICLQRIAERRQQLLLAGSIVVKSTHTVIDGESAGYVPAQADSYPYPLRYGSPRSESSVPSVDDSAYDVSLIDV